MSYSLKHVEGDKYRLVIGEEPVTITARIARSVARSIEHHVKNIEEEQWRKNLDDAGVGLGLSQHSYFRQAVAKKLPPPPDMLERGIATPNGSLVWTAYFSKIDWEKDESLFDVSESLKKGIEKFGREGYLMRILEETFTYASASKKVAEINKKAKGNTYIVYVGSTISRDYSPLSWACGEVYGVDHEDRSEIVSVDWAKSHIDLYADILLDSAEFVRTHAHICRTGCYGLENGIDWEKMDQVKDCLLYATRYMNDRDWGQLVRSPIWLLAKDIEYVTRKYN